ncbi:2'-5' RNA ligase family protein [Pelagibacterium sp. 26DY04]|uniref:2'-5' RNA ligase family protein n=1 Tax=Pelagibacterium sp. 26DY04 TaxID=2967130 RepID=UPI002815B77F|nr:2'-5' RNA ligase family protein [Pelagibacterium sp. 26DY04]WMT88382.1 2'-5' RNA ligase family protein [Pelagibacterium sp. 26DY04]
MFSQQDLFAAKAPVPRYYFALRPTGPVARAVERLAGQMKGRYGLDGRICHADRLHVSLCAVGAGRRHLKGDIDAALAAGALVVAEAFAVRFDTISVFNGPCVVLRSRQSSPAILALRKSVQRALIKVALPPGQSTICPHMTILRPAERIREISLEEPIQWVVRDFVLAQLGKGRIFDIGHWPLRPKIGGELH